MQQTTLILRESNDIEDCMDILTGEADSNGNVVLGITPDPPMCCCSCRVVIPNGVTAIVQHWGERIDEATPPGPQWCWPFSKHIAYLITTKYIMFNSPIKRVPTHDNVRIDVDLSFVFQIGPDVKSVNDFCYYLGVAKFDEMLKSMIEESIRTLVLKVNYKQAYDLKEEWAREVLEDLNERFKEYGVHFSSCKVTEVRLPPQLAQSLSQATQYDAKLQLAHQHQEAEINKLNNEQDKLRQEQQRYHERQLQEIEAATKRAEIEREVELSKVATELEVAKTKATEQAEIIKSKADNEKKLAKTNAEKEANKIRLESESKFAQKKIEAEQKREIEIQTAQALLEMAQNKAIAIEEEAKAEGQAATSLQARRQHELNLKKAQVMQNLAQKGKVIISGQSGEYLLNQLVGQPMK